MPWEQLPLGDLTAGGVLLLVVVLVLLGRLVPRKLHEERMEEQRRYYEARISDLKETNRRLIHTNELHAGSVDRLTESSRLSADLLRTHREEGEG